MLLFRSIILVRSIILDSIRRLWYGTPLCLLALGRGPSHRYGVMHCVVDLAQIFRGQVEVRGRGGTLDVVWSTSADYGDVDCRVRERPGHGKLGHRMTSVGGEPLELLDLLEVTPEIIALEETAMGAPVALREALVRSHVSGEKTVGERSVDQDAYAVLGAVGQDLLLYVAPEEVVGRLQGVELAALLELGHLLLVEVRDPDVADLALLHKLLQRPRGLREGHLRVGPVHLVEVYVVGAQGAQAALHSLAQPPWARVPKQGVTLHPEAAFGRQDHLVPTVPYLGFEGPSQETLGGAEAVGLGGVEEVYPEVERPAYRGLEVLLLRGTPITTGLPGTEADRRDDEVRLPEFDVAHARTTSCSRFAFSLLLL